MRDGACVLVFDQGKILGFRRYEEMVDILALPGGEVDEGETPDVAAVREALEETGLVVELFPNQAPYVSLVHPRGRKVHTFLARVVGGELLKECPNEGVPVWVEPHELIDGAYWEYNSRALSHFGVVLPRSRVHVPEDALAEWFFLGWFDGTVEQREGRAQWSPCVTMHAHLLRPMTPQRDRELYKNLGITDERFRGGMDRLVVNYRVETKLFPDLAGAPDAVVQARADELLKFLWSNFILRAESIPGASEFMFPGETHPWHRLF